MGCRLVNRYLVQQYVCCLFLTLGSTFSRAQVQADQSQRSKRNDQDALDRIDLNINGIKYFLEQHTKTKLVISAALKKQIDSLLQSPVFEIKTFE